MGALISPELGCELSLRSVVLAVCPIIYCNNNCSIVHFQIHGIVTILNHWTNFKTLMGREVAHKFNTKTIILFALSLNNTQAPCHGLQRSPRRRVLSFGFSVNIKQKLHETQINYIRNKDVFSHPLQVCYSVTRGRPLARFHLLQNVNATRDSIYCKTRQ